MVTGGVKPKGAMTVVAGAFVLTVVKKVVRSWFTLARGGGGVL